MIFVQPNNKSTYLKFDRKVLIPVVVVFYFTLLPVSFDIQTGIGFTMGSAETSPTILKFIQSEQKLVRNFRTWETAAADLDSDGDIDLVFASMDTPSHILVNDGKGNFITSEQTCPNRMHGIAIGDLDLDGDQDLFFAPIENNLPGPVYLNNGQGLFQQSNLDLVLEASEVIQLVDIENDGDLDAYLWYRNILCLNNGRGIFQKGTFPISGTFFFSDINADGFVDAIGAHWKAGFDIYLNDTKGNFDFFYSYPNNDITICDIDFCDIDSDGDNDLIYCGNADENNKPGGILLNDGTGRFTDSGQKLPAVIFSYIGIGDLNNDTKIDLVITNREGPASIWLNNGRGQFIDSGILLGEGKNWNNCILADFDNDGDTDIFMTNLMTGNHGLWFNQLVSDSEN